MRRRWWGAWGPRGKAEGGRRRLVGGDGDALWFSPNGDRRPGVLVAAAMGVTELPKSLAT